MLIRRTLIYLSIFAVASVSITNASIDDIDLHADEVTLCNSCHSSSCPTPTLAPPSSETMDSDSSEKTEDFEYADDTPHLYNQPSTTSQTSSIPSTGPGASGEAAHRKPNCPPSDEGYTVNFQDISVIQLIQFISKISGTNFIFDSKDLQFNVTIVSEDPTSVQDLSAALLQILKMHNLAVTEQGKNVLIYPEPTAGISKVSTVISDANVNESCDAAVITRVFRLNNVDPANIAGLVKPLLSPDAVVEVSAETRHLIVSDITSNVNKITDLLTVLDNPSMAFDIAEYQVQNSNPVALVAYAKDILLPISQGNPLQIIPQPSSQKIFIISTPYLIQKAMQLLQSLDYADIMEASDLPAAAMANNQFYMYKLRYQNGNNIATALYDIGINLQNLDVANMDFISTIQSAQWIEVNNSIVLAGTRDALAKVVKLLNELDRPPKQVYIEVLILDTTLTNSLDFGVQWVALGDEQNKLAFASGLVSPPPSIETPTRFVAANPPANPPLIPNPGRDVPLPQPGQLSAIGGPVATFGLGIVGNIIRHNGQSFLTLGALVSALDEEANTTVILNPKVMVEDTQPAIFFVGQNIPYQTTSTIIQQTGSVTQNIQYEDIGIELRVTPTIAPNNVVTLQIDQSIAELAAGVAVGNLTPTTDKILATTRLHVPDGCFLVMSGHIRDFCNYIRSGIPCLGTLPLIGPAFSRTVEQRVKRNLIMFVRPKVVASIQDGIEVTNQEGYQYNWDSNPCSIIDCGCIKAPECESYPPPYCPTHP